MTNFDKLIKERKEQIIDILSKYMCLDSSCETLIDYDYHHCQSCKLSDRGDCKKRNKEVAL